MRDLGYRIFLTMHRLNLAVRKRLFQFYLRGRKDKLAGADLSYLDLGGANLGGASLQEANLKGALMTDGQLARASSLEGAVMPDGTLHD